MSVESCTQSPPKTQASSHGAKGKPSAAGDAPGADASDFSALLSMLGGGGVDGAGDASAELAEASDAASLVASQQDQPSVNTPTVDPSLLLAQSLQLQKSAVPVDAATVASAVPTMTSVVESEAKPQPVRLDTTVATAEASAALRPADGKRPELGETIKAAVGKNNAVHRETSRVLPTAVETAPIQATQTAGNAALALDARLQKLAQTGAKGDVNLSAAPILSALGGTETGVRRAERVGNEGLSFGQGGGSEGAWGHQALLATGGVDQGAFTVTDPSAAMSSAPVSPEVMVAEQVNYWIGRDIQNAELKLDGLGDSPVEVSISLQGNEARVEFRTDQAQARQVLEGATSHLKELLGNEGLVLSGVSVGSSGADGAAAQAGQEGRSRQNGRQANVAAAVAPTSELSARVARPSDRAVDLFV